MYTVPKPISRLRPVLRAPGRTTAAPYLAMLLRLLVMLVMACLVAVALILLTPRLAYADGTILVREPPEIVGPRLKVSLVDDPFLTRESKP